MCVFRRHRDAYVDAVRRERVERLHPLCRSMCGVAFGEPAFLDIIESETTWDLLCHHAAEVANYRSPDFDVVGALASNIRNAPAILDRLKRARLRGVVVTGSFFRDGRRCGDRRIPASRRMDFRNSSRRKSFRFFLRERTLPMGKFVCRIPSATYEEQRFTSYLRKSGLQRNGDCAHSDYVPTTFTCLFCEGIRTVVERLA